MVWVPKLGATENDVPEGTRFFSDRRGRHYWDEGGSLMAAYKKKLGISKDAWDVFFVYGPGARWGAEPPTPDFWMHQLGPAVPAPRLDGEAFARDALGRLERHPSLGAPANQ